MSKAAGAPIGAATGDGITDSQAEAVKRLVPFQSYVGMRQVLDLLTADEWRYEKSLPIAAILMRPAAPSGPASLP